MLDEAIRETFDGEDWVYTWDGGCLVHHEKTDDPKFFFGENIPLFTYGLVPKYLDTVLDVGAGSGGDIPLYSGLVGPDGRVIAIEADPNCYRRLVKLVNLLDLKNVRCFNLGASDSDTKMWLSQERADGLGNSLKVENIDNSIEVQVRDFGNFLTELDLQTINYAKLNIEGSEFKALNSLFSSQVKIKHLCVSCHDFLGLEDMNTFNNVVQLLLENGYSVRKHPKNENAPWESWYIYADMLIE